MLEIVGFGPGKEPRSRQGGEGLTRAEAAGRRIVVQMVGPIEKEQGHFGLTPEQFGIFKSVALQAGEKERQRVEKADSENPIKVLNDRVKAGITRLSTMPYEDYRSGGNDGELALSEALGFRLEAFSRKVARAAELAVFDQPPEGDFDMAVGRISGRVGGRADAYPRITDDGLEYWITQPDKRIEKMIGILGVKCPPDLNMLRGSNRWRHFNIPCDSPSAFEGVQGLEGIEIEGVPGVTADIFIDKNNKSAMHLVFGRDALARVIPVEIADSLKGGQSVPAEVKS